VRTYLDDKKGERMCTNANDRESFMNKNASFADIATRPVGTSMSEAFRESKEASSEASWVFYAMYSEYSTHFGGGEWRMYSDLSRIYMRNRVR
jgi:hypothetical protein